MLNRSNDAQNPRPKPPYTVNLGGKNGILLPRQPLIPSEGLSSSRPSAKREVI
jgi:hypothetical protein